MFINNSNNYRTVQPKFLAENNQNTVQKQPVLLKAQDQPEPEMVGKKVGSEAEGRLNRDGWSVWKDGGDWYIGVYDSEGNYMVFKTTRKNAKGYLA